MEIPPLVDSFLANGEGTWYVTRDGATLFWDVVAEHYVPIPVDERHVSLPLLRDAGRVIASNVGATLLDMGDGVGCVEFHTKMNAIDAQIVEMIETGCQMVDDGDLVGLVVGSEATNFSVGANVGLVGMLAMSQDWDQLDAAIAAMQQAYLRMKYCNGPVVIAPRGMALGGGCEAVMQGDAVRAAAETYIGLVELGVGLIPAAGGCKEMILRSYGSIPTGVKADWLPFLEKAFTTVGTGKVSTSAEEARDLGFLRATDRVTIDPDAVLADAKADVLALASMGYRPPMTPKVPVPGTNGIAALTVAIHGMRQGGYLSEYDEHLGRTLACVLCGGDVPTGTVRSEQDLLDLERAGLPQPVR